MSTANPATPIAVWFCHPKKNMANGRRPPAEFDGFADNYEDLIRDPMREKFTPDNAFFFQRKIQVVGDFFKRRKVNTQGLSWLDVGCGRGDLLRAGRGLFASAAGCDPSEKMLQTCDGFEVRHQTAEEQLPFEDASFDFITAVCVYHHVPPDRRISLTLEMMRLLKPRGIICIMEHNPINPITRLIVSRSP